MDDSAALPDEYFESYEELDIHQLMLNDHPRILAYKNAIFNNKELFVNKTVMDVGAGTGILSVFCAQAGARRVYAIEAATELSKLTLKVVEENNFTSVISVINDKLENIPENAVDKVDIIISEWMGFYLVHEGMLDTVLLARDRFLTPDGQLFPSIAKIHAAPCELPAFVEFWDDVLGVKMQSIGSAVRGLKSKKPEITAVKSDDLVADEKILAWIDLKSATVDDLNTIGDQDLVFPARRNGNIAGICVWFDVEFPDGSILSTSPADPPTHWKQTVIIFTEAKVIEEGEPFAFRLSLIRDKTKKRCYNLVMEILDPEETEHDLPCDCHMTKCIVVKEYVKNHSQEIQY